MRNLKRALSLGLASVMVIGMMATGAGAVGYDDFTDRDEIVNQEAVQMLVELGVIEGTDEGTYNPTGIVTRAEMATIICRILNGGSDPNLGTTTVNSYTDTVGHWASGYIEYCTQLGIVAGDGTGRFNPSATVTGAEAAKMLLVALGYNAEYENMVGASWAVATNVLANQNGLYDGLSINPSEGLTRDNTAQMAYNALDARMVTYDYAVVPDNGSISAIANAQYYEDERTMLESRFDAVKVEGVVVSNEYANLNGTGAADEGKTVISITNEDDQDTYSGNTTFNVSTGGDDAIEDAASSDDANLDNEATFYLTQGGYIAAVGNVEESAYNYALVLATGNTGLEDRARVALSDGSTGTYDVNDSGTALAVNELDVGTIYSYSINSDGEIRLTAANELVADTANVEFTSGRTAISINDNNYYANSNTVFFYVGATQISGVDEDDNPVTISTSDVDVYSGYSNVPDLDGVNAGDIHAVAYSRNDTSERVSAVVFYGLESLSATSVEDIMYITGVNNRTTDYTEVTAFVAGSSEEQTVRVDGRHSGTGVFTFSINSDGYYEVGGDDLEEGDNYFASGNGVQYGVYSANSDTFVLGSGANYASDRQEIVITSDTLLVDDSDYLDDPVGELGAGPDEGDRIAYVVCNNADDMEAVLVVIANTDADQEEEDLSSDVSVISDDAGNDYATPTFYVEDGHTLSTREMRTALIAEMEADGCTDISVSSNGTISFTQDSVSYEVTPRYTQVYHVAAAGNVTNAGTYKGTFSMTVSHNYAADGVEVTVTVTPTTAADGGSVVVTLGGVTTSPATLTFTDGSDDAQTATFTMDAADVVLTMSAADAE